MQTASGIGNLGGKVGRAGRPRAERSTNSQEATRITPISRCFGWFCESYLVFSIRERQPKESTKMSKRLSESQRFSLCSLWLVFSLLAISIGAQQPATLQKEADSL